MLSQTRPTVTHRLSLLERCATEILQQIVLFAAEEQLLGPPSCIPHLLLTSKTLNFGLSPHTNNHLYAKIFKIKFDTAAASRRFGVRWHTNRCLATELRRRFGALKRIRLGIVDGVWLQHDIWTVFLLILEHDYKNAVQLTEWARAHIFVLHVARHWFVGGYGPEFSENVGGVLCRIIWELVREAHLTETMRRELQVGLYSSVMCGYELSEFYASEEFFVVSGHESELESRVRGRPPVSMQLRYYGHLITVAAPPLASACLSVFTLALRPGTQRYTPGYMEEYIPGRTFSERMDDEWYRLVMCHSITSAPKGLDGRRFTRSSLIGSWKGIILVPRFIEFQRLLNPDQRQDPREVPFNYFESELELREHHCLDDGGVLTPGLGPDQIGDDPLHAWIPEGTTFEEDNGTVEVYDPIQDDAVIYETYRTDAEHPYVSGYVPETEWFSGDEPGTGEDLRQLEAEIIDNESDIPDEIQGLANNPSYIDDDEWSDTAEHLDSGIKDIIITGTMRAGVDEHPLQGRIRSWDGLIILHRLESHQDEPPVFSWVFRGYIHGERHIVGRWKQTSTPFGEVGWEGSFMYAKDL